MMILPIKNGLFPLKILRSSGHLRLQFPALVMDLWERGSGHHEGHHAGHPGHAGHEEAPAVHVGHREMTHLEHHHGSHEETGQNFNYPLVILMGKPWETIGKWRFTLW